MNSKDPESNSNLLDVSVPQSSSFSPSTKPKRRMWLCLLGLVVALSALFCTTVGHEISLLSSSTTAAVTGVEVFADGPQLQASLTVDFNVEDGPMLLKELTLLEGSRCELSTPTERFASFALSSSIGAVLGSTDRSTLVFSVDMVNPNYEVITNLLLDPESIAASCTFDVHLKVLGNLSWKWSVQATELFDEPTVISVSPR